MDILAVTSIFSMLISKTQQRFWLNPSQGALEMFINIKSKMIPLLSRASK
jgi:hypothetical protein